MGELNLKGSRDFVKFLLPEENLNDADLAAFKYLVLKYPYCQPLHFAYVSALKKAGSGEYESYLHKAAAYAPKREILHSFISHPESFSIHSQPEKTPDEGMPVLEETPEETETAGQLNTEVTDNEPGEENTVRDVETVIPETEHVLEETIRVNIEEEDRAGEGEPGGNELELHDQETANMAPGETGEKIRVESVASSDYFVFNRSVIDPLKTERGPGIPEEVPALPEEEEKASDLSKYDDYTLPYTFLWWLHKTRKEYEATYQPYVRNPSREVKSYRSGELNQQIIENIFHIQPELNTFQAASVATTVEFELRKKEDEIIEKFIREEPQIRPPQPDKLDTENKARKSSEDSQELVSETLARIYTDQMLYHKAIEIYRKLSLKFPDKKLYFAGQIEELEKKIS